jgi:hypothetical protein
MQMLYASILEVSFIEIDHSIFLGELSIPENYVSYEKCFAAQHTAV